MEIKAILKKPYTNKQRADFIVENNHRLGYEIKESKDCLEAWGMTQEEQEELVLVSQKISVRSVRNEYLEDTDKFVSVPDFPITEKEKNKYIEYRQYLRDYTKLEDWWKQEPKKFEEFK